MIYQLFNACCFNDIFFCLTILLCRRVVKSAIRSLYMFEQVFVSSVMCTLSSLFSLSPKAFWRPGLTRKCHNKVTSQNMWWRGLWNRFMNNSAQVVKCSNHLFVIFKNLSMQIIITRAFPANTYTAKMLCLHASQPETWQHNSSGFIKGTRYSSEAKSSFLLKLLNGTSRKKSHCKNITWMKACAHRACLLKTSVH